MTQEELTAWISAGAAVVQAVGAIAAIWFSISLARASERRSIEAERASAEREKAAEAAAVMRAEEAERRSAQREKAAQDAALERERHAELVAQQAALAQKHARQEQAIRAIEIKALKIVDDVENTLGQYGAASTAVQFNGTERYIVNPFLDFLDQFESDTADTEMVKYVGTVREAALRFRDNNIPNPSPANIYVGSYRGLARNIVDSVQSLRTVLIAKPAAPPPP